MWVGGGSGLARNSPRPVLMPHGHLATLPPAQGSAPVPGTQLSPQAPLSASFVPCSLCPGWPSRKPGMPAPVWPSRTSWPLQLPLPTSCTFPPWPLCLHRFVLRQTPHGPPLNLQGRQPVDHCPLGVTGSQSWALSLAQGGQSATWRAQVADSKGDREEGTCI